VLDSTSLANPYHNLRHGLHVTWESYDGGIFHLLNPEELRCLLIASLFHDANHSGKIHGKDHEEIETALLTLRTNLLPEDKPRYGKIESILRATEFPYIVPENELSVAGRIIRDADLSQNFSPVWIQQSWIGLAQEMGMDPMKFLRMQPNFLRSVKFFSGWGVNKFEPLKEPHIQEIITFIERLDGDEPTSLKMAS